MLDEAVEAHIRRIEERAVSDLFLSRLDHASQVVFIV